VICNIGSVVLGVIACTLACFAISRKQAHRYTVASFSFCVLSLLLQFFEMGNRVNAGDFAAIADTIRAIILAAVALVGTTVALNVIALTKRKQNMGLTERRQENE
jgi:drug/metabolite transporter (DMT)-like permease